MYTQNNQVFYETGTGRMKVLCKGGFAWHTKVIN